MDRLLTRTTKVVGTSILSQLAAWALMIYLFGVKQVGYMFFDVSDIPVYYDYALRIAQGALPFKDVRIEYPPLAVPLFTLPGHLDSVQSYAMWFAAEMIVLSLLAGACTSWVAVRIQKTGNRPYVVALLYSLGVLLLGAITANRYDVAVALVLAGVLALVVSRQLAWAAFLLGVGFALKLVPVILLPLVLILSEDVRGALRSALAFTVAAVIPFAFVAVGSGTEGLSYLFTYHLSRPLEVESLFASPFMVAVANGWTRGTLDSQFGSQTLLTPGIDAVARIAGPVALAALGAAYWLIFRRREVLIRQLRVVPLAMLLVLMSFVVFGKVLSPQYLIWLLPFIALIAVYRPLTGALLLGAVLMTHVFFPANYWSFAEFDPTWTLVLLVRNLVLLGVWGQLMWTMWRLPEQVNTLTRHQAATIPSSSTSAMQ